MDLVGDQVAGGAVGVVVEPSDGTADGPLDLSADGPGEDAFGSRGRRARRRLRGSAPRPHRFTVRFSDEELEAVTAAASLAGMSIGGYVGSASVAVAIERVRPAPVGAVEAMEVVAGAQLAVNRYGVLLNQVVAKWHAMGQQPGELVAVLGRAEGVLSRLDEAALGMIEVFGSEAVARRRARAAGARAVGASGAPGAGEWSAGEGPS